MKDLPDGTTVSVNGGPKIPLKDLKHTGRRAGRMRETPDDDAERERLFNNAEAVIKKYADQVEAQTGRVKKEQAGLKAIWERFKAEGYDPKMLKRALAEKALSREDRERVQAELDLYIAALEAEDEEA